MSASIWPRNKAASVAEDITHLKLRQAERKRRSNSSIAFQRHMFEIDWKMIVDISQVIASAAVAVALWLTIKTFAWAKRADQIKLAEGVFKDLREMQRELHGEGFNASDWDARFLNTLE